MRIGLNPKVDWDVLISYSGLKTAMSKIDV